jgi:hypothetical protein
MMDSYVTAILRILVKRQENPIEISNLIDGFPNYFKAEVSSAVFHLRTLGYISIYHSPTGNKYVYLNLERRREVLRLINPELDASNQHPYCDNTCNSKNINKVENYSVSVSEKKSSMVPSVRRSIIAGILVLSAVSTWALLTTNNHIGVIDPFHNKINQIQRPSVSNSIDYSTPQSARTMLISNILDLPSTDFTIIQAGYPIYIMNPTHYGSPDHILIIEQIDSMVIGGSIKKITSDDSHKYKI